MTTTMTTMTTTARIRTLRERRNAHKINIDDFIEFRSNQTRAIDEKMTQHGITQDVIANEIRTLDGKTATPQKKKRQQRHDDDDYEDEDEDDDYDDDNDDEEEKKRRRKRKRKTQVPDCARRRG